MANSVLLQAGAYSKFAQSKTASQTSNIYTLLNTMMQETDNVTEDNLKQLFETWNTFIESEYHDEKEKWCIDFDIANTTQSTKVNEDNTIDFSDWIDNSPEQETTSIVAEIENIERRIDLLTQEVIKANGK